MNLFRWCRKFTFEEVTEILISVRKPNATIASVCAEYGISFKQFMRWYAHFEILVSGITIRLVEFKNRVSELESQLAEKEEELKSLKETVKSTNGR